MCTQPSQYYDEYAFIPFIGIIYLSATPAFSQASENAKRNNAPYGIIITTTPGDLTTEEGRSAYNTRNIATKFTENMYDKTYVELNEMFAKNQNSTFVHIRYTYQQLGRSEEWFMRQVKELERNWSAIRREILLEWSEISDNAAFTKEDIDIIDSLCRAPIRQITVYNHFTFDVYEDIDLRYPPLVGVDVSAGVYRDSSAIVIVDSKTTRTTAAFNCNYISPPDLAGVVYELVTKYMRNAVVNVERNGGFGQSVLAKLVKTSVKRNLYFEIKDRVIEERTDNFGRITRTKQKTKVYGLDSTKAVREILIDILRQRVDNHKDKFISPILVSELKTLEVKRNGKVEHSSNGTAHDDTIFAYLLALYIWYEGKNLREDFGITKSSILTDSELDETLIGIEEATESILGVFTEELYGGTVKSQLDHLSSYKTMSYDQYLDKQKEDDRIARQQAFISNPKLKEAYLNHYKINTEIMNEDVNSFEIPAKVFEEFYK